MSNKPALPTSPPVGTRAEQLSLLCPRDPGPGAVGAVQLSLLGQPAAVRLPAELWRSWLDSPIVVARFEAKRYVRRDSRCWPWLGAVSDTGHGSFRAASLPGVSRRGTVPAHLFAYQLIHGVIPRLGWSESEDPVVCHRCDSHGCVNPHHLRLGTAAENRAEWARRHRDPSGPLADVRGPVGRTRAIAQVVRTGLSLGESPALIDARILTVEREGLPLTLW
nr:HNH endonuclease [Streptacidiphilus melanogenes]